MGNVPTLRNPYAPVIAPPRVNTYNGINWQWINLEELRKMKMELLTVEVEFVHSFESVRC